MSKRARILAGMGAGAVWAVLVVWLPGRGAQPFIPLNVALIFAFLPGGLVMLAVIARLAARRFFDDEIIDGERFAPGSPADLDQRVLTNTIEQMVLALLVWPAVATFLGAVTVIVMGVAMGIARIAFWVGYRVSPPLRAFGFAASFYPTLFAVLLLLWRLVT